jgi:hypothetical protein
MMVTEVKGERDKGETDETKASIGMCEPESVEAESGRKGKKKGKKKITQAA